MRSRTSTFLTAAALLLPVVPAAASAVPSGPTAADESGETVTTTSATPAPTGTATTPTPATTTPTEPTPTAPTTPTTPEPTGTTEPTPTASTPTPTTSTPTPVEDDGPVDVDDAELRWGLSNEANNRAFAPGTYNFFSAGRLKDPGGGGTTLRSTGTGATWSNGRAAGWSATSGDVTLEKWDGTTYRRATFAGTSTDANGDPLPSATSGTFSGHQMVFGQGEGEVDATEGTATIRWDGDVTVLFYSGMSFFYLSDPVLKVRDGIGTVTASLGGFGSSQADPTAWKPLTPTTVTIADLGRVDLTTEGGFTITPRYLGVTVSGVGQAAGVPYFGAFPQSWVDFHDNAGTAAFWLSSGGSADQFKPALPMTISYDAAAAVTPPTPPTTTDGDEPTPDTVDNDIVPPPTDVSPPDDVTPPNIASPANIAPAAGPAAATGADAVVEATPFAQVSQPVTTTAVARVGAPGTDDSGALWWWLGGSLLLAAALTLTAPSLLQRPRTTTR